MSIVLLNKGENKMKKLATAIIAALSAIIMCAALAACSGSAAFEGTYKFSSMTMKSAGMELSYKAGESYMGMTLTEDFYVFTAENDGTWKMTASGVEQKGTWKEENGKYILTADGETETIAATLNGDTLTINQSEDGSEMTIVLKKA